MPSIIIRTFFRGVFQSIGRAESESDIYSIYKFVTHRDKSNGSKILDSRFDYTITTSFGSVDRPI